MEKSRKKDNSFTPGYGAFSSNEIKKAFRYIALNADLIFPREYVSYNYVTELVGLRSSIKQSPDFTNLIDGKFPVKYENANKKISIIPNYRMIDKTTKESGDSYTELLVKIISYLESKAAKPFFLIHESADDMLLVYRILEMLKKPIDIIIEQDPIKIKGIIGRCDGVIGSRYHGLVSGLSQGVPTLGTGWSHKYKTLFEEYHFKQGYIENQCQFSDVQTKLNYLINKDEAHKLREKVIFR
jgi:polysaccharide pyruvyl transferase WcaK-like protein